MTTIPKEDVRHCLVFYDWPECVPNGTVLSMGEAFLEIMKGTIDYSEVIYSPDAKRRVIHRQGDVLTKLRRGIARRADDCGPLFLIALREDKEDMFTLSNWTLIFSVDQSERETFAIFGWSEEYAGMDMDLLRRLTKLFCTHAKPVYGIAYSMHKDHGPYHYSMGLTAITGRFPIKEEARRRTSHWYDDYYITRNRRHQDSMLRDVYPFSILSPFHLQLKVGDMTLKEWIERHDCGELEPFEGGYTIWTVPEDKIEACREELTRHDLLIATAPLAMTSKHWKKDDENDSS